MKKIVQPVRKAYAPHHNAVRRVLNSQAPGQVGGNPPIVPRILKQKAIPVTRCYVCDETIEGRGFPLVMAGTVPTKTNVPYKIGKLMGEGFMVIVSVDDVICKRCSSLFNLLDRLETDLDRVSNTLSGYLKVKYKLNEADSEGPPSKMLKTSDESVDDPGEGPSQQEIETQLSNMFGSPVRVAPKDETKSKQVKMYKCVNCEFKTTDLPSFQPHYEKCLVSSRKCTQCDKVFSDVKLLKQHTLNSHKLQTCSTCHISFVDDALYKDHLEGHLQDATDQNPAPAVVKQKYLCTLCNFSTFDKQVHEEHKKKHIKLRPFKCRVCSQRFESREKATIHAKAHQPDYFKCGLCSATFQKRELLMKHLEKHEANKALTPPTTQQNANTTQRLLQAFTEEALRDTNIETEEVKPNTQDAKQIEFYTCTLCSLTFLSEALHAQHMKQHVNTPAKKITGQSLIRQDVRNANVNILNPAQSNNTLAEGDLESIFEKMHSDKVETTEAEPVAPVTTTTESETILYNINIPQDNKSQDSAVKKHENVLIFKCDTCNEAYSDNDHLQLHLLTSGHGASENSVPATIDMPNLDQPDEESDAVVPNQEIQNNSADANTQEATSLDNKIEENENNSQQEQTAEAADHVPESNTEPVPMELEEDMNNCEQPGELKLMLGEDNQLMTSDGQILQLDNNLLTTDSEGNRTIDNAQLQQLLQSVGVVVQNDNEDGNEEELQLLDNSKMVLVQTDDGETRLISRDMLDSTNFVLQSEDGTQITLEQAQAAGIDISALMVKADEMEEHDGEKGEEQSITFSLDELCQLQNEQTQNEEQQNESAEQSEEKNNPNSQQNKPYICGDCGYTTNLRIEINFHMSTSHQMCLLCRNVFHSSDLLLEHVLICSKSLDDISMAYSDDPISLEKNRNILQNDFNELEENNEFKDSVSEFLKSNSENLININMGAIENDYLKNFSENNDSSKVYQCDICSMIFSTQLLCNNHILQKHLLCKCDICDKTFTGKRLLKLHYNATHKKPNTTKEYFECSLCHKFLNTKFGLDQHLAQHDIKYSGVCPFCDWEYITRGVCNEHLKTHEYDLKYTCKICAESFTSIRTYEQHRRVHTKSILHSCEDCGAVFRNHSALQIHKRRNHSADRPFKCDICSMTFVVRKSLTRHKMLHSRNHIYRCEPCARGFVTRDEYVQHAKKIHNIIIIPSEIRISTAKDNIAAESTESELNGQSEVEDEPFTVTVKAVLAEGLYDIMNLNTSNINDDVNSVQNLNFDPQTADGECGEEKIE